MVILDSDLGLNSIDILNAVYPNPSTMCYKPLKENATLESLT